MIKPSKVNHYLINRELLVVHLESELDSYPSPAAKHSPGVINKTWRLLPVGAPPPPAAAARPRRDRRRNIRNELLSFYIKTLQNKSMQSPEHRAVITHRDQYQYRCQCQYRCQYALKQNLQRVRREARHQYGER